MASWYGSGSADPYLRLTDSDPTPDPAPDPAILISDLQHGLLLFKATFTSFFKDKSHEEVSKHQELKFFSLFLLDYRRIRIRTSF